MSTEVKKIQIAPYPEEITVSGNEMKTAFAGGITYKADGLDKFDENFLKGVFSAAIAISGRRWHLQHILNDKLNLDGVIS